LGDAVNVTSPSHKLLQLRGKSDVGRAKALDVNGLPCRSIDVAVREILYHFGNNQE
jgi:hypothetical protein